MSTLATMDRMLKMIYGAPSMKADRYIAASTLREAVHDVVRYDAIIARPMSPQQRAAAIRWRRRAMRRRRVARANYHAVRAAWHRATPTERERGGIMADVPRRSMVADLFFKPSKGMNEWRVQM